MNLNLAQDGYFGPDNILPDWTIKKCKQQAFSYVNKYESDPNINIDTNPENLQIHGQLNALVSFIGPHDSIRVKHNDLQIMIRGLDNEIKYLQSNTYDIFNLQLYNWIAVPPNSSFMNNPQLHDQYLNQLIIKHKYEVRLRNELYDIRKKFLMNGKIDPHEDIQEPPNFQPLTNQANKDWTYPSDNFQTLDINHSDTIEKEQKQKYNFAIINIIGNTNDGFAIKIHGLFKSEDDAKKHADILKDIYSIYDHYIVEMYRWIPLSVNPDDISNKIYQNDKINNLFKEHELQTLKVQEQLNKHPQLEPPKLEIVQEEIKPSDILKQLE